MSLITNNTQIRLISELAPAGGMQSTDLIFVERDQKNHNQSYSGLVTGLVDNVTTGLTGSNKIEVKNNAITTNKIIDNAITTNKIIDNNVTLGKLATVSNDRVLGNTTGGGTVNQITIDQTLSNSADNIASSSAIKNYMDGFNNIPLAVRRVKTGLHGSAKDSGYIGTGIDVTSPHYAESSFALRGPCSWQIYSAGANFHGMSNIFIKKNAGEEPYIVILGAITNTSLVSGFLSSNGASLVATEYDHNFYYNFNYTNYNPYYNYNYKRHHVSNELCFSISITNTINGNYSFGTLLEGTMQYRGNIISPGEGTKF